MRRTIIADEQGRYRFRSIVPSGYGVPPGSPTEKLLTALGRHGQRPARIHFFISADGHRKLTTQINLAHDPLVNDDFAHATREGLVCEVVERNATASIQATDMDGPFGEITTDISLPAPVQGAANQTKTHQDR